jgi:integrase
MTAGPKISGAVIPRRVFTQPGSKREAALFGLMSASTSSGSVRVWRTLRARSFPTSCVTPSRLRFKLRFVNEFRNRHGKVRRYDIVDGRIRVSQDKARKGTINELMIPIHPALARALKAGPVIGMKHLITDARGRPLRGLTDLIERAVARAGLPAHCVAHGLRGAASRRLAEAGCTTKEITAISGHRSLAEIERYTVQADQGRLAQAAVAKLPDKENG